MKIKALFILLAFSLCAGVSAHADDYGGEYPQQRPHDDYQDDYQYEEDIEIDEDYYVDQDRGCRKRRCQQPPQEYYCPRRSCNAPEVLPYLGPQVRPVPMPVFVAGACTIVGQPWGWTIVLNGRIPLVHGQPFEMPKLIFMKQHYFNIGVCRYYTN